jgi:hypothetical protein
VGVYLRDTLNGEADNQHERRRSSSVRAPPISEPICKVVDAFADRADDHDD